MVISLVMLVYQRVVSGLPAWEFYHFYIFVLSELWMYFWGYGFCTFRWPVQIINVAVIEEIYIYIEQQTSTYKH